MKYFFKILCCIFAVFVPACLFAEEKGTIESIRFLGKEDSSELIELKLSNKVVPHFFQLAGDKPRIVFDFAETGYDQKGLRVINADGVFVKKVRVGVHNTPILKTRVVVDLAKGDRFTARQSFRESDNLLIIAVSPEQIEKKTIKSAEKSITAAEKKKKVQEPPEDTSDRQETEIAEPALSAVKAPETSLLQKQDAETSARSPKKRNVNIFTAEDGQADPASQAGAEGENKKETPVILDVSFEKSTNDKEMVLFRLSGFFPPIVFSSEEDKLRVVCDFLDGILGYGIENNIDTGGKYIEQLRIATHKSPDKVRVVLDLAEKYNYDLKQVFFKEDNLFVVIISNLGEKS